MSQSFRLNVYISSTAKDLVKHRQAVGKAVLDLGDHPVAMEHYGAVAAVPLEKCLADVRACDVYVLLVAWRYGFVPEGQTKSITALEYQEAVAQKKPCLVFVLNEDAPWPRSKMDKDATQIEAFRDEAMRATIVDFFDGTEADLTGKVIAALTNHKLSEGKPAAVEAERPKISIAHLPPAVTHFVGRDKELARLDEAWDDPNTPVISLVAFGGVGKSALVAAWLEQLRCDNWRGAERVLGHSFYSQGSRDEAQVSADGFIDEALRFFGDPNPEAGSAWDKGERLARLVRQRKTLLILDGLEPMQWGASSVEVGRLKDQGLIALVRELAAENSGLCLITTRQAVADIPTAAMLNLEALSEVAGAALLKALGVQGLPQELKDASRQVRGHGLALRLLGTYLRKVCQRDVRRIGEVDLARVDQRLGGHAWKVVEKYERWLGEGVELSILRLLGLFDRPAEPDSLAAVCAAPAIPGLTDALVELGVDDWSWAITNLVDYGLLSSDSQTNDGSQFFLGSAFDFRLSRSLDAHPLIREYFAAQLTTQYPEASREAHRRLYEHLKQAAPEFPDTLPAMMPLYHAMVHGGKAELWQEALDDVYYARIERQNEQFGTTKLGAMGADLSALSVLFQMPFSIPNSKLTVGDQAYILNSASFSLRALGRLTEATQPMQATVDRYFDSKEWQYAAVCASNLSELYLTLGDVAAAVRVGEQAVELADRSCDRHHQLSKRIKVADALHQAARLHTSQLAFREAEAIQAEAQPQYPLLYSSRGFFYCDLLLAQGLLEQRDVSLDLSAQEAEVELGRGELSFWLARCGEVRDRAKTTLKWVTPQNWLLDMGLDNLTLGRTYLLEAILQQQKTVEPITPEDLTAILQQATHHLDESVLLLRQSGQQDVLPRGLLARAALYRVKWEVESQNSEDLTEEQDYIALAERDLTEVEQIAGRSGMLIHQIEAALEYCRLALTLNNPDQASTKLNKAKALIKQTERPYEPHTPTWSDWDPPEYINVFKPGEIVGYHRRNGEIAELEQEIELRLRSAHAAEG